MITKIIQILYFILPKKIRNYLGSSQTLTPLRNRLLRSGNQYREICVLINRSYNNFHPEFYFYSSVNVADRAKKKGIESTLLRNSITLLKKYKINKRDAVIFDVGSNFGFLSLVWSKTIATQGKVYSFEPHPDVFHSFEKSIEKNKLNSIISGFRYVVGGSNTEVLLALYDTSSGILKNPNLPVKQEIKTSMITLDSFVDQNDIKRLDLIKIDVDGPELEILKGARNILKKLKPVLIVETNENSEILDFLLQNNYLILDMDLKSYQEGEELPVNVFGIPM